MSNYLNSFISRPDFRLCKVKRDETETFIYSFFVIAQDSRS